MNATTVAVDIAKNVYQLALADGNWRVIERHRLTRTQFERFFANREVTLVVMEACGSAHYWARQIQALGIQVRLLPPRYIRAYVKRNKTDAADAAALLEAVRCADIVPVRISRWNSRPCKVCIGCVRSGCAPAPHASTRCAALGTGHTAPTSDAGYTTASVLPNSPVLSVIPCLHEESI